MNVTEQLKELAFDIRDKQDKQSIVIETTELSKPKIIQSSVHISNSHSFYFYENYRIYYY